MSLLDDFAGLFDAPPPGMGGQARVVQGQIVTFDKASGHNTVNVMGGVITDAQIAVNGADIGYVAGDPVLLQVIGNTYTILCKVTPAGGTNYASAAQATSGYSSITPAGTTYSATGTFVTMCSASIVVPVWANRITFFGVSECSFKNTSTTVDGDIQIQHMMNGNGSGALDGYVPLGNHQFTAAPKFHSGVQSVTPGSTIQAQGQMYSTVALSNITFEISGTCIFSKA